MMVFVRAVELFFRHDQYRVFCLLTSVPPLPRLCRSLFCPGQHLIKRTAGMHSRKIWTISVSSLHPLLRNRSRIRVTHDGLPKIINTVIKVKPCCTSHLLAVRIVIIGIGSPSYRILDKCGINYCRSIGGSLVCTYKAVHLVEYVHARYPISVVHECLAANQIGFLTFKQDIPYCTGRNMSG